jgi:hypothetical protein
MTDLRSDRELDFRPGFYKAEKKILSVEESVRGKETNESRQNIGRTHEERGQVR